MLVENGNNNFLMDCGIMPGVDEPYPCLSDIQIQSVKWLFITHSHIDHTGAYTWLCERGFSGNVVMTRETARQLPFLPERILLIDELTPAMSAVQIADGFSVMWGRSGHCAGSVWYNISSGNKNILFSGDYLEDTLIYRCDFIRGSTADIAVLDSAYGESEQLPNDYRRELIAKAEILLKQKKKVMFPVPKYGRGLELLLLLYRQSPDAPFILDAHLQNEITRIHEYESWLKPEIITELQNIPFGNIDSFHEHGFVFVSDPQLKSSERQKQAEKIIDNDGIIIITGNADSNSFSENLLLSERASFLRYSVHMSDKERLALERHNCFTNIVPYHK